jgi:hypothetical protein
LLGDIVSTTIPTRGGLKDKIFGEAGSATFGFKDDPIYGGWVERCGSVVHHASRVSNRVSILKELAAEQRH